MVRLLTLRYFYKYISKFTNKETLERNSDNL